MTKSGNPIHFDIDRRYVAERALGEAEEIFKLLVLAVRDYAIFALDPKGYILTWNAGAERLKGYTADEIIGSHFSRFYTPKDIARNHPEEELKVAVREGVYEEEGWRVKKDGSRFWANVVITALLDSQGNLRGFAKVTRDLTEKKLADEKLRQNEEQLRRANELLEAKVAERTKQLTGLNRLLAESELRYRTLTETIPQLVWTDLPNGECDYLSSQWIEYTGIPFEEQKGFQWVDLVLHPDDKARVLDHWMGAVKGLNPYDIEYRIRRHDGVYRWFKTRGTPIRNEVGEITYWIGTCTDIQDRKEAEAKLTFERHQLETIFRVSPAAMALWSGPDFVFEKVNANYGVIFPDRVLVGKPFLEACPEFKDQPFQELLTKVFETGEPFIGHEVLVRHADFLGGPLVDHYYDFTYVRVNDAYGKPYGVYDHAIDVTDKVRARETIQNQKLWLEEVLNRLPIGLIMAEPNTANYQFTNHAAQLMLGQAPKDGRPELGSDKLIVRDLSENILSVDETPSARAARGEELTNEVIILDKGKDRIYVSCNSNIIPAMPGHKKTVLVPFLNISDLKAKEFELERVVKALEDNKNKLLATVHSLEEERDLKERFVAMLSHDLRTPLTAAKMSVALMNRNTETIPANRKLAQRIDDGLNRMDSMIRDLLDASRIKAGEKLPLEIGPCDLNQIVVDTFDGLRTIHGDRFTLHADHRIEGYWSKGDVRRILENLASNAIKYGAARRPISVVLSQNKEMVQIAIHNEGSPISPEDQAKLFLPFKRIESNSSGLIGWGLGLTLVKGFAEAHGGSVTVESTVNSGTRFRKISG